MAVTASKNLNYLFILLLLLLVHQTESKRSKGGGRRTDSGRHTTPRSHYTTPSHQHHPPPPQHQDIGFENVQNRVPSAQNNQPIGFNVPQQSGAGHLPPAGDTIHKTNVNQVGNSNPSAPIAPPPNNPGIGFENVQNRGPPQNNQPTQNIGFNVPQNSHSQPGVPSAPLAPLNAGGGYHPQTGVQNPPNVGFNAPPNAGGGYHPPAGMQYPQNNGFNAPPNAGGGYHPQSGFNNAPPNAGGGYHPQYPGYGGNNYPGGHPGSYYPNAGQYGGGGVYNPQSYYNPHFAPPNGIQPQIYQPIQQSSGFGGGSLLGYAGTFGGGYLLGRLTSGGHDDRQYTVHHYHHNRNEVAKQINVTDNSLVTCTQNQTQGLCVPNTFPLCLANGTIMCATHAPYTVPCGINSTTACVISVLPCTDGNSTCDNNTANLTTTAVYVPCISNVTVAKQKVQDNTTSAVNTSTNPLLNGTNVVLCVTAIAEPKIMPSPVPSYINVITQLAMLPFELNQTWNNNSLNTIPYNVSSNSVLLNNTGTAPIAV